MLEPKAESRMLSSSGKNDTELDLIERKLVSSTRRHQAASGSPASGALGIVLTLEHYAKLYYSITKKNAMHTTNLRKVGGSVMLAVPPALLDILRLQPGAKVGIAIESGRLVVEPKLRRRFTLDELLAKCNPRARRTKEEKEWIDSRRVGRELI